MGLASATFCEKMRKAPGVVGDSPQFSHRGKDRVTSLSHLVANSCGCGKMGYIWHGGNFS